MNCCKTLLEIHCFLIYFFCLAHHLGWYPIPPILLSIFIYTVYQDLFLWKLISLYWFPLCRCPETLTGLRCQFPNPFAKKISTGIYNSCFGMSAVYLRKVVWKDLKKIFYQTNHFKIIYYFLNNLSKPQCPQLNQK